MSQHPCQRCDRAPATEDSLYCPACKVQLGLDRRLDQPGRRKPPRKAVRDMQRPLNRNPA